jgi:Tfp pilus assembly protein PilE
MIKKTMKTMLGVTLLEIMLVLAIAAMVIVLSIKYYQSANASSQANAIMGTMQSITAASENLAQATGNYSGISQTQLQAILPPSAFTSPWAGTITYSAAATSFTVTAANTPKAVCVLVTPKLKADIHTSTSSTCPAAGGNFVYVYVASP